VAGRLNCRVTVLSRGKARLAALEDALASENVRIAIGGTEDPATIAAAVAEADLVIGAVLEPGTLSPKLVSRRVVRTMRPGSAIVDIGIDQGGICETSRMTTLTNPTYVEENVVHYAVPNMPALVARTATLALAAAALPYLQALADHGIAEALNADPGLAAGLMVWDGAIVHAGLAADAGARAVQHAWRSQPMRREQAA
jgi:alanine dehydrogenase